MRFGVARTQGKNLLRQRHDAAFRRHYGPRPVLCCRSGGAREKGDDQPKAVVTRAPKTLSTLINLFLSCQSTTTSPHPRKIISV